MKNFIPFLLLLMTACSTSNHLYHVEKEGGLSGLAYEGKGSKGELIFWSHTDRGPNAKEVQIKDTTEFRRPFMQPDFKPYWVKFSVDLKTRKVKILQKIELGMSGLPNKNGDEIPVDKRGRELPKDIMGIDPESMCFDGEFVWMGEEYRPSLLKFDLTGKLLRRFVPQNTYNPKERGQLGNVREVLPEKLKKRKLNRGFEGLACSEGNLYAALQSPLPEDSNNVLIFQFNTAKEKVEQEYHYPLNLLNADKIGDLAVKGIDFYIIEQNGEIGPASYHKIFRFRLNELDEEGKLKKKLILDLVKLKYDFADKVEGLAILDDGSIAVLNDNDFGLTGEWNKAKGEATKNSEKKSILGIFSGP